MIALTLDAEADNIVKKKTKKLKKKTKKKKNWNLIKTDSSKLYFALLRIICEKVHTFLHYTINNTLSLLVS